MSSVERVLDRLGIRYERHGPHLSARCPYHEDRTPSWRIRRHGDKKGLHFCQACKEGGDLVELIRHVRGLALRDSAKQWLEQHELSEEDVEAPPGINLKVVGGVLGMEGKMAFKMPAGVVCGKPLSEWPGPPRQEVERRGITELQANLWDLGYAVEGRLAGRVVVPVSDRNGRLCSYMARSYGGHPRRYFYPSEEEGADMSVIFGEEVWPEYHPKQFTVVVTEGAFKSLAVERVVCAAAMPAALGGSPYPSPPSVVAKLAAFGRVLVMTDNDEAGNRCGDHLVECLRGHTFVARVKLPPDRDPDEMLPGELAEVLGPFLRLRTGSGSGNAA